MGYTDRLGMFHSSPSSSLLSSEGLYNHIIIIYIILINGHVLSEFIEMLVLELRFPAVLVRISTAVK